MSLQQAGHPRPTANGTGRRRGEQETGFRSGSNFPTEKPNHGMAIVGGILNRSREGGVQGPSRDRLIYLAACLIGHRVEVQVKNGSIFSGILHAMNAENDFGIVLKMANLTKVGLSKGHKPGSDSISKAPSKTLIVPAKELVQVIAKDVSVTGSEVKNDGQLEGRQDLMIDSYISKSQFVDAGRELAPWAPDEDDLQCPELDNIFDGPWNSRKWDQFETNEALFGVKSTFDEELYTTKLDRGPQMREREREASRIAREIEGEDTKDMHLAEERGRHFDLDVDEETRFSSVLRTVDDSGYDEDEDIVLDTHNMETFGDSSGAASKRSFSDVARGKTDNLGPSPSSSSVADEAHSRFNAGRDQYFSASGDRPRQIDCESTQSRVNENKFKELDGRKNSVKESVERKSVNEVQAPNLEGSRRSQVTTQHVHPRGRSGSSASSTAESAQSGASPTMARSGLSPSSSMGSLSSEKSALNPNAKEFKFNPNAKSFTPSVSPVRPPSPVPDGSYYYPNNVSPVQHMHGLPVGVGMGAAYGGPQPVMYTPQGGPIQPAQTFLHPNGQLYGQQMIVGHPRQVLYMPNYPPDMPYKGRDF
ncbi:polyadenylate-binding protein-interacting protein 3-like isoform X1 [Papaver somniferum]|uniref:polyadenylate-binding protein-interacting protein 3-like isoform X1 n=1 Tax=Papaver somniferum TaxID=3469 RepID=UPI000E701183|nr:polyadenylate-binding protein-interacting protein 3-like isoform X1 [Papaver somniferum]XP_026431058.1 polyadenylate-binding protein-interacting protein 3-like isoform X1 [Papaver somniferum]